MGLEQQRTLMLSGAMYDDLAPEELIAAREQAVLATMAYNASFSQPPEERLRLLRERRDERCAGTDHRGGCARTGAA